MFEQFPYSNFHNMNNDWILNTIKAMQTEFRDFISQNSIKYANPIQWNITTQYERNTVVIDVNGDGYLSVKSVPSGISIEREEYWTKIGNFSALWGSVKNSITLEDEGKSATATKPRNIGNLVWLDNNLVEVIQNMIAGDTYVLDSNCKKYSMQILLNELDSAIANEANARATLQTNITNEANARETADTTLQTNITNEANARETADTTLQTNITNEANARMQDIANLQEEIGTLSASDYVNPSKFGAIGNGIADDRKALQDTINFAYENNKPIMLEKGKTYLIASLNPTDYYNLLTLQPNTTIIGNFATIKIANGMQYLTPRAGSPYIFPYNNLLGTVDIDINTINKGTLVFKDIKFDLNGQNNLMTSPQQKNNCAIFITLFDNCIITNCTFKNANGNQVVMLFRGNVGSKAIFTENEINTVADAITGNYSFDHSSLYVQSTSVYVYNNTFKNNVMGGNSASAELHCVYIWFSNNLIYKYTHGVYGVAEYYNAVETSLEYCDVGFNSFIYTRTAFAPWTVTTNGATNSIKLAKFHDNYIYAENDGSMILADSSVLLSGQCEVLEVVNNVFKFNGGGSGIFANNKVTKIVVKDNKFLNTHNTVAYLLCNEIMFNENEIVDASISSTNTYPIWIEGVISYLEIRENIIKQNSAYATGVFNIIASIANGTIKGNKIYGFTKHFNFSSSGILTTNKCIMIHSADIDLTAELYGSSGSEFTLLTTGDKYFLNGSSFGKAWLMDAKNFTSYFDHTKLPYDFGIGTFYSFVNGDTTTPTTQGMLIVQKYNTNTAYNKWIKSFFYPASNSDTFYISSGVDGSNAWSAWSQYNKVTV